MKTSKQNAAPGPSVRILKSAICPTLSGRSKLTYELGCKDGSQLQLRIVSNSAAGSFTRDWIDVQAIRAAMEKVPRDVSITSDVLGPLFRGKSVNNRLFTFAVLKHEGLVQRSEEQKRGYERAEFGDFVKRTQALIEGKAVTTAADAKTKVSKARSTATAKRANTSRKK